MISNERTHPLKGYERHFLVKGEETGLVFCSKIPSDKELIRHYDQYPRNDYFSPVTLKRYESLLDRFEKYRSSNTLLDIGCGIGLFLDVAANRGWHTYGTEFTETAADICRKKGHSIALGKLDPSNYLAGSFDIIVSIEVLEHISNPQEELNNIYKLLRPGGLYYFTTPNFNSAERLILKDRHPVIEYPEHLCYYTTSTVDYFLKRAGFVRKSLQTTGLSPSVIAMGLKGKRPSVISPTSDDERLRVTLEKNFLMQFLKNLINGTLTLAGMGNSIKGFYEKPAAAV